VRIERNSNRAVKFSPYRQEFSSFGEQDNSFSVGVIVRTWDVEVIGARGWWFEMCAGRIVQVSAAVEAARDGVTHPGTSHTLKVA